MKSLFFTLSLSLFTFTLSFAQEAELPKETGEKRSSYYHDDTPLNAFHSIYSDIYIHRWLDAPHDGMEPIPQAEQDKISDIFLKDSWEKKNYAEHLNGLLYREKWDEVIERLPEILKFYESIPKMKSMDLANYGTCYMAWPQALMGASEQGRALRSNRGLLDKHDLTFAGILGQISSDAGGIGPKLGDSCRKLQLSPYTYLTPEFRIRRWWFGRDRLPGRRGS